MREIEAYIWRDSRNQKLLVSLAHNIAMLSRQKRIPTLKALFSGSSKAAKPLKGREKKRRRKEFKDMTKNLNLSVLNKRRK